MARQGQRGFTAYRSTLQPGLGPIRAPIYLPCDPTRVLWGRLPCAADRPVLTIDPGAEVTIDTLGHEGLLEDQGRDPAAYFGARGVRPRARSSMRRTAS